MSQFHPRQLEYSSQPLPWRKRKHVRRSLIVATCLLASICAWVTVSQIREALRIARIKYCTRKCMAYAAPAGQVIYEEDTANATALSLARSNRIRSSTSKEGKFVSATPVCWTHFWEANRLDPLIFLHERVSPDGTHRLIATFFDGWDGVDAWSFTSFTYSVKDFKWPWIYQSSEGFGLRL